MSTLPRSTPRFPCAATSLSLCWALPLLPGVLESSAAATPPLVVESKRVIALQREPENATSGRYDWGPSVMKDGGLYRMWWTRLGGSKSRRFPYRGTLPDGETFEFTYPDWGDRIYYAESRDGLTWHLEGDDFAGPPERFGPDAPSPLRVLGPSETAQQRNHLGNPSVLKVEGTYYLYYEAPCEYTLTRGADGKPRVGDEYHNQIFLAVSQDGRSWSRWPDDQAPQPIIAAPESNRRSSHPRYGLGQPSACYFQGRFVLHYVDSCTGPGDFIVRVEADNPFFRNPRRFARSLAECSAQPGIPAGAVARFAQTDVKYLADQWWLARPAYGTNHFGLLASSTGVFAADAQAQSPRAVFPQLRVVDPRGPQYGERLYPRFLTDPHGQILVQDGCVAIYYASGLGFKDKAYTWDLYRCEVETRLLQQAWERRDSNTTTRTSFPVKPPTPGTVLAAPADVAFTARADGSQQRYVELLPLGFATNQPYPLLIFLHGHGSDRWQITKGGQWPEIQALYDVAARRQMILISPDYRATTSWMGPAAEADLVQIIQEQKAKRRLSRTFLCGGSMGGTSVLIFTALHPELVDGVVSMNGTANMMEFAGFQDAIAASYGGRKSERPDEYRKRSPELMAGSFRAIPVAFTAGGKDTVVPPPSVLRLSQALEKSNPGRVLMLYRETVAHTTSYQDAVAALEFVLERATPSSRGRN